MSWLLLRNLILGRDYDFLLLCFGWLLADAVGMVYEWVHWLEKLCLNL